MRFLAGARATLLIVLAGVAGVATGSALGQAPTVATRAPLPPGRPFDLDLQSPPPGLVVPAPPAAALPAPAQGAGIEEDEGPEWPRPAPGQKLNAEPEFDPEEKPERPGISTDPGTSIICLPPELKLVLNRIVFRYGAVKVTSTWRPPWRARRGSYHKRCQAMDFRVPGVRPREVLEFARTMPETGGSKVYWNGLIHVDTGPRRPF